MHSSKDLAWGMQRATDAKPMRPCDADPFFNGSKKLPVDVNSPTTKLPDRFSHLDTRDECLHGGTFVGSPIAARCFIQRQAVCQHLTPLHASILGDWRPPSPFSSVLVACQTLQLVQDLRYRKEHWVWPPLLSNCLEGSPCQGILCSTGHERTSFVGGRGAGDETRSGIRRRSPFCRRILSI